MHVCQNWHRLLFMKVTTLYEKQGAGRAAKMWEVQATISFLLAFSFASSRVEGARILCASHQMGSHMLMVHSSVENLIARGHEVYTIFSDIKPVPKDLAEKGFKILKYHTPPGGRIMADPEEEARTLDAIFSGVSQDHTEVSKIALGECYDIDNDKALEKQLHNLKFDLVVLDTFPPCTCLMFLPLKLNAPFIVPGAGIESTRIPLLPSFYPLPAGTWSDNMSFMERVKNTIVTLVISVPALSPFPAPRDTSLLEKYNKDPSVTTWNSLARKAQLHLVPRGGVVEYPIPLTPNAISIECLTCRPGKPLQSDIQQLADSSTGIIVVSFGSLISQVPDETAVKFLKAFEQRNELIFWRYKLKLPGKVPPNVKVMNWLPQNDLLAHPKTKLFITHSGSNGLYESVYQGVPMLAFPLFAEQFHNAHCMEVHGFGLVSSITSFTTEELSEKMERIINEPSFREKTQHASRILRNWPMNARETCAFWIDHVLEFGSDHLRSHALDMPWYSFYMIDIMLLFEAVCVASIALLVFIVRFLYRKFTSTKQDSKKKTN